MDNVKNTSTHRTTNLSSAALVAASPAPAEASASSGGSFKDALEQRLPIMLTLAARDQATDGRLRARSRVCDAATVVREHGMPLRHQAARMALATAAGAYDWFFKEATWTLSDQAVPGASLTWLRPGGALVVDLCSCDPLTAAAGPAFAARSAAVWDWARASGTQVALVRLLQLTAPMTALGMTSRAVSRPLAALAVSPVPEQPTAPVAAAAVEAAPVQAELAAVAS